MEISNHHKICVAYPEYLPYSLLVGESTQLGHLYHSLLCEHLLPVLHNDKLYICGILLPTAEVSIYMANTPFTILMLYNYHCTIYSYSRYLKTFIHFNLELFIKFSAC